MKIALTFDDVNIIPKYSEIKSRSLCNLSTIFTKNTVLQIPIISSPMDTITEFNMASALLEIGAVGVVHRFQSIEDQCNIIYKLYKKTELLNKKIPICAAIGIKDDYLERAGELIYNGCDVLLIDVAHGDHLLVKQALTKLKTKYNADIIAGSVATHNSTKNLCEWGADAIRVGLGNGSMCSTRIKTGVGIPQFTAIKQCVSVADKYNIPIIADGGLKTPGDISKAIAAGADSVMLGSLLAGTKETPGKIKKVGMWPNEQLFKEYRGSASLEAKLHRHEDEKNIEGESKLVFYKGKLKRIITDICDGLKSSMSYVGAMNIDEFHAKSEFIRVTNSGIVEASPHGLNNNK